MIEAIFYNYMREMLRQTPMDFIAISMMKSTNKGKKQISEAKQGFVVKDDIVYGYDNVIPLWHFGMNY